MTGQLDRTNGQNSQNVTATTGQGGGDNRVRDNSAGTGQLRQNSQKKAAGEDSQARKTVAGKR
jgi:hypothetical protein